jgi:DNA polymerase-3 subunit epsilon
VRFFGRGSGTPPAVGFAVVDVETTGLFPTKDRIVELAIVHVDAAGSVTDQFCTLIDPKRDVGPVRIHGLTASSLVGAPTFAEAAPTVWRWLRGRVFVAHNAPFDLTFLDAELSRCGMHLPPPPVMCTMRLSSSYLAGLPARTLTACCEAAGVSLGIHHSALDDALAAAQLLGCYRSSHRQLPPSWEVELRRAVSVVWADHPAAAEFRPVGRADQAVRRARERPPLADLVHRLPQGSGGDTEHYLGVLDRVLEDRVVTSDELAELSHVAVAFGVTRVDAERAHRQYLAQVAAAVWEDSVVTKAERADLLEVARLLAIPADEALAILEASKHSEQVPFRSDGLLRAGDKVAFTGEMEHRREELERLARSAGLRVMTSVSAKTALLVVADPHSESAKARSARECGVRSVAEQVFLHLVGQTQGRSATQV